MISLLLIFFLGWETQAGVNAQSFPLRRNFDYVLLEDSFAAPFFKKQLREEQGPFLAVQFNTIDSPLTMFDVPGTTRTNMIKKISTLSLGAQWSFAKYYGLGLNTFVSTVKTKTESQKTGFGDTQLFLERQILNRNTDIFGLSVMGEAVIPTGEESKFLSNGSTGLGFTVAADKSFSYLDVVVNLGFMQYEKARFDTLHLDKQVPLGLGLRIPLGSNFSVNTEGKGVYLPEKKDFSGLGDLYIGGAFEPNYNGQFYFGAGVGRIERDNSSSVRLVAGYVFMPWMDPPEEKSKTILERIETIKTIDRCGPKPMLQSFSARRLTPKEKILNQVLPYSSTTKHSILTKNIGEMSGFRNGLPYVKDSQILFAIDMDQIPSRSAIIELNSAYLKMEVRKVSSEKSKDTEILCILNDKVCSGETFEKASWRENVNQKFFGNRETPNDYFTKLYLDQPVKIDDGFSIFAGDLIVDIRKIIENSLISDLFSLFFKGKNELPETLYFVVADDTFISNEVSLEVNLTVDSCKTEAAR